MRVTRGASRAAAGSPRPSGRSSAARRSKTLSVGLVGVGKMGSQMAKTIRAAKFPLTCWDVDPEALLRTRALGANMAKSNRHLARDCDIVLLSLPKPDDVREVVAGEDGLVRASRVRAIADCSTVDPETSRAMATLARTQGIGYCDSPVLGRPAGCGSWTLPVGGVPADVDMLSPVLSTLASRVVRVGAVGSGNAVKLLNNLMFGAINAITVECFAAARRVGLDEKTLFETIADSGAATVSGLFKEIGGKILSGDWSPTFSLAMLEKDNRLGLAMLTGSELNLVVAESVLELDRRGVASGFGQLDTSALLRLFEPNDE